MTRDDKEAIMLTLSCWAIAIFIIVAVILGNNDKKGDKELLAEYEINGCKVQEYRVYNGSVWRFLRFCDCGKLGVDCE